ncbi:MULTISPECIES: RICIN domain-containing protein [unclassified Streptomyces]|uniref:RICIN domain-containing protein n=1 Tax=unclassified Streptomyces TaxID=2593676 RepID=UPI001BEC0225|nr:MULTISPECIES: RICIN domain-containing protein [unclassified Streptomyces]MBT2408498.1 RICIN domain-containing protein [Streptomyces sp. ISL-21]MBT2611935.1 RICIN domain-containing protein [Streptomyces sp. ISL-87]
MGFRSSSTRGPERPTSVGKRTRPWRLVPVQVSGRGKCLNVQGAGNVNGTQVIQYTCGNADNELWKFVPKGIGYQIVVKSSNKCLNVAGGVGVGYNIIQYDCTSQGVANDVWLPVWEPNSL